MQDINKSTCGKNVYKYKFLNFFESSNNSYLSIIKLGRLIETLSFKGAESHPA